MADQEYTLDLLERFWIHTRVANERPVIDLPKAWRCAINVIEKLDLTEDQLTASIGKSLDELHGQEETTFAFTPDEAKFIVQQLILQWEREPATATWKLANRPWVGRELAYLVPLWDKLYRQWEEITPQKPGT